MPVSPSLGVIFDLPLPLSQQNGTVLVTCFKEDRKGVTIIDKGIFQCIHVQVHCWIIFKNRDLFKVSDPDLSIVGLNRCIWTVLIGNFNSCVWAELKFFHL